MRGTTVPTLYPHVLHDYFYPRTPCGVRHLVGVLTPHLIHISIHVPRAGYDPRTPQQSATAQEFLSTYPVRGTTSPHNYWRTTKSFLSTYPVRGTTSSRRPTHRPSYHFYPRTPCGVRRAAVDIITSDSGISIHVPRAGYDCRERGPKTEKPNFYPRTPCGVRLQRERAEN